jgi:hypothetical protein
MSFPAAVWSAARPSCSGVTRDPSLDRPLQDGLAGKPRAARSTRSCRPQTVVVGGVDGTWCTYKQPPLTTPPSGANKGKPSQETPPRPKQGTHAPNTHTHTHTHGSQTRRRDLAPMPLNATLPRTQTGTGAYKDTGFTHSQKGKAFPIVEILLNPLVQILCEK